jgi:hypothetical protein
MIPGDVHVVASKTIKDKPANGQQLFWLLFCFDTKCARSMVQECNYLLR